MTDPAGRYRGGDTTHQTHQSRRAAGSIRLVLQRTGSGAGERKAETGDEDKYGGFGEPQRTRPDQTDNYQRESSQQSEACRTAIDSQMTVPLHQATIDLGGDYETGGVQSEHHAESLG